MGITSKTRVNSNILYSLTGDDYRVKLYSKGNTAVHDYINAVYVNVSSLIWISLQNQFLLSLL